MAEVKPVPEGFTTVSPHLVVRGAKEAIEYYREAFGADVIESSTTPDGNLILNAVLRIGDANLMIADEMPMMEYWVSPAQLNGTTVGIHLFVDNVDAWFERAKRAGIDVKMEPQDMFWGDRYCQFFDKYGHAWSIATRVEDVSQEEADRRGREWFEKFAK
ncbi:MAG: hypothetical protein MAG453_00902 [Calditrichaeota bacterium]|nr:hypothetical protein [Calditrichota bacterium]